MANTSKDKNPLMRLQKERTSLGRSNVSLGDIEAYAYNKEKTDRSLREMISTQLQTTAKEVPNGILVKKVDFFIRQEELPHLSAIKMDSDMEPEPLDGDYLVRLKVQLDTFPVTDIGPIGLQVNAKCYIWEEACGGLQKLGSDSITFGMLDNNFP